MVAEYIAAGAQAVGAIGSLFGGDGSNKAAKTASRVGHVQLGLHQKGLTENPLMMRKGWEAAGIHPIYGMGGSSASFSPSFSGGGGSPSVGERMSAMGQGISRAAEALTTERERLSNRLLESQIKGQEIENTAKASQLALNTQAGTPPAVIDTPLERIMSRGPHGSMESGDVNDMGFTRTSKGGYAPVKSKDATERLEDDFIGNLAWNLRNRLLPSFGILESPPPNDPPKGYVWKFNPFTQSYTAQKKFGPFTY